MLYNFFWFLAFLPVWVLLTYALLEFLVQETPIRLIPIKFNPLKKAYWWGRFFDAKYGIEKKILIGSLVVAAIAWVTLAFLYR